MCFRTDDAADVKNSRTSVAARKQNINERLKSSGSFPDAYHACKLYNVRACLWQYFTGNLSLRCDCLMSAKVTQSIPWAS